MINKTDTYKLIKSKLKTLSLEISNCISVYKRKYKTSHSMTIGKQLVTMRQELDEINNTIIEIIPTSKVNPRFRKGDFVHWNGLWNKYKEIKE